MGMTILIFIGIGLLLLLGYWANGYRCPACGYRFRLGMADEEKSDSDRFPVRNVGYQWKWIIKEVISWRNPIV